MSSQATQDGTRDADPAASEDWGELADLIFQLARELHWRGQRTKGTAALTPSEGTVMRHVLRNPGALPSQVADATGLQRTNLSTVLRGLAEKGLIERVACTDDARSVHIQPTARAIETYERVRRDWATALAAAANGEDPVEETRALLARLGDGLARQRQSES